MALQYRKEICDCHGVERYIVKRSALLGKLCQEGNQERLAKNKEDKPSTKKSRVKVQAIKVKDTSQRDLFLEIWERSEKVSFLSGKPLAHLEVYKDAKDLGGLFFSIFGHILSKGLNKYPKFKLYEPNIKLLHPEEHRLYDHGTISQRERYGKENNCSWDKIYELEEQLKEEYKEKFG